MKLIYTHNFKNIPNHALTHYVSDAHNTAKTAPKTVKGFAKKPAIQRKASNAPRPVIASITPITKPKSIFTIKMPGTKFRKNIDKLALAEYFDNSAAKDIRTENKQAWLERAVAEVNAASAAKEKELDWNVDSSDYKTREAIREFVESIRPNVPVFRPEFDYLSPKPSISDESDVDYSSLFEDLIDAVEANYTPQDVYPDYYEPVVFFQGLQEGDEFEDELFAERVIESSSEQRNINSIDTTAEDKFERLFFENEINKHVLDAFKKKMRKAPQERSMTKMHNGQLRRDMRKMAFDAFRTHQK